MDIHPAGVPSCYRHRTDGNAIAKVIGKTAFGGGGFSFNLVDRNVARGILQQSAGSTQIAPLRAFYSDVVPANWEFFQWFLTFAELAIGIGSRWPF